MNEFESSGFYYRETCNIRDRSGGVVQRAYVPDVDLVGGAVLDELVNDVREGRVLVVVAPVAAGAGWCRPSTVTPALIPSRRTRNKAKLLQNTGSKLLASFCRLVADSPAGFTHEEGPNEMKS